MLPVRALISIAVLPGVVAVLVPWRLLRDAAPPEGVAWVGLMPLAPGLGLFIWCVWDFATRGRGTLAPWDAPRTLVATGPYRVVRNPMYVAVLTVLAGEAILFRSVAVAVWLALMLIAFHAFVLLYEEPTLERAFDETYRAYRRRVPRWIPRGMR
jgi:protein-S-isoprenylcysteine O-methyltransferase Ste14